MRSVGLIERKQFRLTRVVVRSPPDRIDNDAKVIRSGRSSRDRDDRDDEGNASVDRSIVSLIVRYSTHSYAFLLLVSFPSCSFSLRLFEVYVKIYSVVATYSNGTKYSDSEIPTDRELD